jgi:hypothetical protein
MRTLKIWLTVRGERRARCFMSYPTLVTRWGSGRSRHARGAEARSAIGRVGTAGEPDLTVAYGLLRADARSAGERRSVGRRVWLSGVFPRFDHRSPGGGRAAEVGPKVKHPQLLLVA